MLLFLITLHSFGQEDKRIQQIQNQLELLSVDNSQLKETLKLDINVSNITLPNFLLAVSKVHKLNLSVSPDIGNITIVNNFSNVTVADLLVYLSKEYQLDIEFTGNIIAVKRFVPPVPEVKEREIPIHFDPSSGTISLDLQNDPLDKVFRKIMDTSGENLLFSNDMGNQPLTLYLKKVPFDIAMQKLASTNKLLHTKSRDGFHLFNRDYLDPKGGKASSRRSAQNRYGNGLNYQVLDTINKLLNVDFKDMAIATIINELAIDLDLDIYTATPLEQAGKVTFNAKKIYFDDLLEHIFASQETRSSVAPTTPANNRNPAQNNRRQNNDKPRPTPPTKANFTFKKENNIYFFGTADQLSLRQVEIVQLMHRSVELLGDPSQPQGYRSSGRTVNNSNVNFYGSNNLQKRITIREPQ